MDVCDGKPHRSRRCLARSAVFIAFLCLLPLSPEVIRAAPPSLPHEANPESLLVKAIDEIRSSRLDSALSEIDGVLREIPNFRLAQLIKGDLLLARSRPITAMGPADGPAERIEALREEARMRVLRYREQTALTQAPHYVLQLQPQQHHIIVVDIALSRLYLYKNVDGEPRLVQDYYVSSGKNGSDKLREGDKRTPVGVYYITDTLPKKGLSDFYGVGAYPISYPNEWDRLAGRNGSGIWIHGTPRDTYSRPPRASDGCVVLTNADLAHLGRLIQSGGTPVIITRRMEWSTPMDTAALRDSLLHEMESWRQDWESRDTETFLSHYSKQFSAHGQNFAAWARDKRQINAAKAWIKVGISNLSMFRYPGRDDLIVVTFTQNYSSNNLSDRIQKRQYWIREQDDWRIIYEGAA